VSSLFSQTFWRRFSAALLGVVLGLSAFFIWSWYNHRAQLHLAEALYHAYEQHDAKAMEALFCWEGVDEATHSRVRLAILQEFELPVESVVVKPLQSTDSYVGLGLRPNLKPQVKMLVTYGTPDHLSAAFLAGRQNFWGPYRLMVMVRPPDSGS
jgi:hypothetical protein